MFKEIINFRLLKIDALLLFVTGLVAGVSFLFKSEIAYENGPIENLQAVILFIGMAMCFYIAKKECTLFEQKNWQAGAILFFIAFTRELSWGRVFYPSSGINTFIPLQKLWFGPVVYPILVVLILIVVYIFFRYNLYKFLQQHQLPFWHFVAIVILLILAGLSEHSAPGSIGIYNGEVLEEIFELSAYLFMLDTVLIMSGKHE